MENIVKRLEFIRKTLREEFPSLSKEDLGDILKFIIDDEIQNGEVVCSLKTLEDARKLCRSYVGKEVTKAKQSQNRVNVIKEDDEYALAVKRAFGMLTECEQASIIENLVKSDVIEFTEDYVRAAVSLLKNIYEEDESLVALVQPVLLRSSECEKDSVLTIEDLGRSK